MASQEPAGKSPFFTLYDSPENKDKYGDVSGARVGRLCVKERKQLETPNYIALTSRGVVPHISPDVINEHTDFAGVLTAIEDFVENASRKGVPPIMKCPARDSTPLHTFTALPSSLITMMAPRRTPAVSAPNGNTDGGVSVYTSNGFYSLKTKTYAEYAKTLKPDIAIALGDVPYGPLPGVKRAAKMGDRTSMWVDEFLSDLSKSDSTNPKSRTEVFAPVLPIPFVNQWEYLNHVADDLVASISGLAFYSSSLLPEIPATTAISRLPRLSLDNPHSPHEILRQISLGMDIFTVPFVGFATDGGVALTFEFPAPSASSCLESESQSTAGPQPLATDLSFPIHASSTTPLSPNCTCYACTQHHRAYIQHLLHAKEMLGWVLLNIHNHAVLSRFFQGVRERIAMGTFEKDREAFERFYEAEIAEGQGQKPRARGYHFKSEGPGERKRNKPAWGSLGEGHSGEKEGEVKKVEEDRIRPEEPAEVLDEMGFAEKVEMEGEEAK